MREEKLQKFLYNKSDGMQQRSEHAEFAHDTGSAAGNQIWHAQNRDKYHGLLILFSVNNRIMPGMHINFYF